MDRLVDIKNLVKQYYSQGFFHPKKSATLAVDRMNLGIDRNTVFGLVGESGCGKTSLARAVLYLDPPTSGEIWFDGTLLGSLSAIELRPYRKRMQIVFQDPDSALNPKMRIRDSLAEGLLNRRVPSQERSKRINHLLDLVGISTRHKSRYPHEFSGGQKQRIVIARALTMEPDFLILDEPVSNLDVSIQAQIINLLLDLKQKLALTYLFISHDLNLVAYLSDQIGVMYRGRLVEQASTEAIMRNPRHPYTLKLFSSVPGKQSITQKTDDHFEGLAGEKRVADLTSGCPYLSRCRLEKSTCRKTEPELKEIEKGHLVACVNT